VPGHENRIRQPVGDRRLAQDTVKLPLWEPGFAVVAFYAALAPCTVLWWHWDQVGLPRLLMGDGAALRGAARDRPRGRLGASVWGLLAPVAIIVAAFFWYPLAPTAVVLALVFIANTLWFG